jgi:hypothetical protein
MLTLRRDLFLAAVLVCAASVPAAAQCTVGEIIDRMVTPVESADEITHGEVTAFSQGNDSEEGTSPPEFVFTPEIAPAQREALRRVGRACSWTSDVSNCTFRRVARMALRGKDASFIYDKCSD